MNKNAIIIISAGVIIVLVFMVWTAQLARQKSNDILKKFNSINTKLDSLVKKDDSLFLKNDSLIKLMNWSYYFQMIVYSCNTNGKAAIQIIFDNNLTEPDKNRVSFSIITDPYAIIQLGNMLKSWNPLKDKKFSWIAPN